MKLTASFRKVSVLSALLLISGDSGLAQEPGSLDDTFRALVHGQIQRIVLQKDEKLLVGGKLMDVDGTPVANLARLNSDGTRDVSFNVDPAILGSPVWGIALQADDRILTTIADPLFIKPAGLFRFNQDGSRDTSFAPPLIEIDDSTAWAEAVVVQPDGKILLGGGFARINQVEQAHLARLQADGSLDTTFRPKLGGGVKAITVAEGKILIGGNFGEVGNVPRNNLARLNLDGTLDNTFDSGLGPVVSVNAIQVQADGRIVVGVFWEGRNQLLRLQSDGSLDQSWKEGLNLDRFEPDDTLRRSTVIDINTFVLQPDGRLIMGGQKQCCVSAGVSARLDPDGHQDLTFRTSQMQGDCTGSGSSQVRALALLPDGRVVIGGCFTGVDGVSQASIARLLGGHMLPAPPTIGVPPASQTVFVGHDAVLTVSVASYVPPSYQWIRDGVPLSGATNWALTLRNAQMTQAGSYVVSVRNPAGEIFSAQARLAVTGSRTGPGSVDLSFDPGTGPDGTVTALALQSGRKLLVGGDFKRFSGAEVRCLVRLDAHGGLDPTFKGAAVLATNATVNSLLVAQDNFILVGGAVVQSDGTFPLVRRLAPDGSLDSSFSPDSALSGLSGAVVNIAVQSDGRILLAGGVSFALRLMPDGTRDPSFQAPKLLVDNWAGSHPPFYPGGFSEFLVQPDGRLLALGVFQYVDGVRQEFIARLNPDGSLDPSLQATNKVAWKASALQPDGKIVSLGSLFGVETIQRLNADGTLDPAFNPGSATDNRGLGITAISLEPSGKLIIGGFFTSYNGTGRTNLARLNSDGSLDMTFDAGTGFHGKANSHDAYVTAFAIQSDGVIVVAGRFGTVDGVPRPNLARIKGDVRLAAEDTRFRGKQFSVLLATEPAREYSLEYKDSLAQTNWMRVPSVAGDGSAKWLTDPSPATTQRFYRTRAQ